MIPFIFTQVANSREDIENILVDKISIVHVNDVIDLPLRELKDEQRVLVGEGVIDLRRFFPNTQQEEF